MAKHSSCLRQRMLSRSSLGARPFSRGKPQEKRGTACDPFSAKTGQLNISRFARLHFCLRQRMLRRATSWRSFFSQQVARKTRYGLRSISRTNRKAEAIASAFLLVRKTGLEPVRCEPHAPQTCASASSATLAYCLMDNGIDSTRF